MHDLGASSSLASLPSSTECNFSSTALISTQIGCCSCSACIAGVATEIGSRITALRQCQAQGQILPTANLNSSRAIACELQAVQMSSIACSWLIRKLFHLCGNIHRKSPMPAWRCPSSDALVALRACTRRDCGESVYSSALAAFPLAAAFFAGAAAPAAAFSALAFSCAAAAAADLV